MTRRAVGARLACLGLVLCLALAAVAHAIRPALAYLTDIG